MTLTERLAEYVRACFMGIWIQSQEHQDALVAMAHELPDRGQLGEIARGTPCGSSMRWLPAC